MTVKKKSSGELEEVRSSLTTNSFRWVLLVLVLSMHPWGRAVLNQLGFRIPNQVNQQQSQTNGEQSEEFVIQKNTLSALEKIDSRLADMEKNQRWQVEQEVKRLKWEPFKSEPTPSPNVNR